MFVSLLQIRRQHTFNPFHECADSARLPTDAKVKSQNARHLIPILTSRCPKIFWCRLIGMKIGDQDSVCRQADGQQRDDGRVVVIEYEIYGTILTTRAPLRKIPPVALAG
jgi:hypothetical protein